MSLQYYLRLNHLKYIASIIPNQFYHHYRGVKRVKKEIEKRDTQL